MCGAGLGVGWYIWHTKSGYSPDNTYIVIDGGSQSLSGTYGTASSQQYTAKDNGENDLTDCDWSITAPTSGLQTTGVSIDSTGKVSWTAGATSGSFIIVCTKAGYHDGMLRVNFKSHSNTSHIVETDGTVVEFTADMTFMTSQVTSGTTVTFNGTTVNRADIKVMQLQDSLPIPAATNNDYGRYLCHGFTNLTVADIVLPAISGSVGNYFCSTMFDGCSSLAALPSGFNLPSGISGSVGNFFCAGVFDGCSSLSSLPRGFNLPNGISGSVGHYFCTDMFVGCSSLVALPSGFNLPSGISGNVGDGFCSDMFKNCTVLTSGSPNENIVIPNASDNAFCDGMFGGTCPITQTTPTAGQSVPVKRS